VTKRTSLMPLGQRTRFRPNVSVAPLSHGRVSLSSLDQNLAARRKEPTSQHGSQVDGGARSRVLLLMEAWILLMIVTRGNETVQARVPMSDYEQCMAAGHYAEFVASQFKDVKVNWTCQSNQ